jgi:hypothetical protein
VSETSETNNLQATARSFSRGERERKPEDSFGQTIAEWIDNIPQREDKIGELVKTSKEIAESIAHTQPELEQRLRHNTTEAARKWIGRLSHVDISNERLEELGYIRKVAGYIVEAKMLSEYLEAVSPELKKQLDESVKHIHKVCLAFIENMKFLEISETGAASFALSGAGEIRSEPVPKSTDVGRSAADKRIQNLSDQLSSIAYFLEIGLSQDCSDMCIDMVTKLETNIQETNEDMIKMIERDLKSGTKKQMEECFHDRFVSFKKLDTAIGTEQNKYANFSIEEGQRILFHYKDPSGKSSQWSLGMSNGIFTVWNIEHPEIMASVHVQPEQNTGDGIEGLLHSV